MNSPLIPRHIPPTATPLPVADWARAVVAPHDALAQFSTALGEYLGSPHLFFASSGRTALRLLLDTVARQPQWGGRSEVVLPGYTCPALAKVILDAGLTPRLVDLDPVTFTYPSTVLSSVVSEDTLAIIVVHPFGIPVALGPALAAARKVGALVIEDAAQSMGARVEGRLVGTRGYVGLYSLGPGKPMSLGGGGVVATADDQLADALREEWAKLPTALGIGARVGDGLAWLRLGIFSLAFQPPMWWLATHLGAQKVGGNEASWGYQFTRLTDAQAAMGLALLPRLDAINAQRRERAQQLMARLADLSSLTIPGVISGVGATKGMENTKEPIFLRLPLLPSTLAQADTIFAALQAAGIGVGRLYGRTISEFFPQLAGSAMPGSERVARMLLTLPTNYHLQESDVERISSVIHSTVTGG